MIRYFGNSKLPQSDATNAYDLLRDVKEVILEEPARLDMSIVCMRGEASLRNRAIKPMCDTVGCVAGWVMTLKNMTERDSRNASNTWEAEKFLHLKPVQAQELFYPEELVRFDVDKQTAEHAEATAEHIEWFLSKYENQLKSTEV